MSANHILVDGYSVLHQWKDLKRVRSRSLTSARQELILLLIKFHDCHGGQLTVVFDGQSFPSADGDIRTNIRVIYSRKGETADAVIERIVGQSKQPHSFLVVTDDGAERSVVEALGAQTVSAERFHEMIQGEIDILEDALYHQSLRNRRFLQ